MKIENRINRLESKVEAIRQTILGLHDAFNLIERQAKALKLELELNLLKLAEFEREQNKNGEG